MRLLEHEAKQLLREYDLPVPEGKLVTSADVKCPLPFPCVVKVQIPIGGRGKAGGVRVVTSAQEYQHVVSALLGSTIKGYVVESLLVEAQLEIAQELYVALTIDRDVQSAVVLAHKEGGVEIESAQDFWRKPLSGVPGNDLATELAEYFDLPKSMYGALSALLQYLWNAFIDDALLVEINPLVLTQDGALVCADAKVELDAAAAFRHPRWHFQAPDASAQFVVLDAKGTVASMANGAGLAMATMDAIAAAGAQPANFFDVGGGTSVEGMTKAFQRMSDLPEVQAIVVNIFAGITRCDQVAQAIIAAKQSLPQLPPLFIRLSGTNEAEGKRLLAAHDIPLLPNLAACVNAAVQEVSHV